MLKRAAFLTFKLRTPVKTGSQYYCVTNNNNNKIKHKSKEATLEPGSETMKCQVWTKEQLEDVKIDHFPPKDIVDYLALWTIKTMRFNFDVISGYALFKQTESTWLNRIVFLEVSSHFVNLIEILKYLTKLSDCCWRSRKYCRNFKTSCFFTKNEKRSWMD